MPTVEPAILCRIGKLKLLVFLLVLAAPTRAEWHVSGYLGGTHTQNSFLRIDQPARDTRLRFSDVGYRGASFQFPLYYGVRGGYFFHRHIGVEAEFIHLKVFADPDRVVPVEGQLLGVPASGAARLDTLVKRFSISHGVNLLLANVVARKKFGRQRGHELGRVVLAARLGFGGSIPHPESNVLGEAEQHYEAGGAVLQAAAGAEVRLVQGLHWLGEYKYTRTRQRVGIVAGTAETLLHTHHLVFGLAFHF